MKSLLTLLLLPLLILSCKKSHRDDQHAQQTCYTGRYVAQGCWPVIQLLQPQDGKLPTATYDVYEHSFGTGLLPEKYKDGKPFFFSINKIDSNIIYQTYCTPTKYVWDITPSDSVCILCGN